MRIATIAKAGIVAGAAALALGLVACSPSTQEFGEETDTSTAIEFTNSIGDEIVGIAYKESDDESYPDDLMGDDDSIAVDEVFILNLEVTVSDSAADDADDSTSDAATDLTDAAINVSYDIQVTPASGEAFEITDIVFGDFTSAEICYSTDEELGYLVYTSESSGEEVSTLDSAIAARDAEEQAAAEAEAAAAEAAEQEEATEQEETTESSTQESYSSGTSSSSGSSTSSGSTSSGSTSSSGSSSSTSSSTDSATSSDSVGSGIEQSEDNCLDDAVLNE